MQNQLEFKWKLPLLLFSLAGGALFVYLRTALPTPPVIGSGLSSTEMLALYIFYTSILIALYFDIRLLKEQRSKSKILSLVFFILALVLTLQAGYPKHRLLAQATETTYRKDVAALNGYKLAEQVRAQAQSAATAREQLSVMYPDQESREAALTSLELALTGDKSESEVIAQASPQVPYGIGKWECGELGCGYADSSYMWTISTRTHLITVVLTSLILLATTGLVHQHTLSPLLRRRRR